MIQNITVIGAGSTGHAVARHHVHARFSCYTAR